MQFRFSNENRYVTCSSLTVTLTVTVTVTLTVTVTVAVIVTINVTVTVTVTITVTVTVAVAVTVIVIRTQQLRLSASGRWSLVAGRQLPCLRDVCSAILCLWSLVTARRLSVSLPASAG